MSACRIGEIADLGPDQAIVKKPGGVATMLSDPRQLAPADEDDRLVVLLACRLAEPLDDLPALGPHLQKLEIERDILLGGRGRMAYSCTAQ